MIIIRYDNYHLMQESPDSVAQLENLCRSEGFDFEELQEVREGVYRGIVKNHQLENSSEAFIKIHPPDRRQAFQEFVDIATDVGHPECYLLEDEYLCLVMGVADGRPLSQLLPLAFFPGVWRFRKRQYERAYFQLGMQLGRLHTATRRDPGPVLSDSKREKSLEQTQFIEDHLDNTLVEKTRILLQDASNSQVPYAVTYGDRSPHNILFNGSSVSQIDFAGKQRSTVYEHTSVLVGLRLMYRRLPYASSEDKYELEQSYWEGYKQTGITPLPTGESVAICCLTHYLHLLYFYSSGVSSLNAKLTKWVDPPIIREEIRRTVQQVS